MSSDALPPEVLETMMRCVCLYCKGMRMMAADLPVLKRESDMKARWESFQVCDCGPCEHIRSEQRQAKLDTGELSG